MQVVQTLLSISSIEQKYQIGPRAKCVLFVARETSDRYFYKGKNMIPAPEPHTEIPVARARFLSKQ